MHQHVCPPTLANERYELIIFFMQSLACNAAVFDSCDSIRVFVAFFNVLNPANDPF